MARVTVIGAGAIGTCFAAELIRTGRHQISVLSRTPRTELIVHDAAGTITFTTQVRAKPVKSCVQDWILIATKTTQAGQAATNLAALSGPATKVL